MLSDAGTMDKFASGQSRITLIKIVSLSLSSKYNSMYNPIIFVQAN